MTFQKNFAVRSAETDEDKAALLQQQSEKLHGNKSNYTKHEGCICPVKD